MVSSICFGVVFFGKYFFSLLVLIFKVSFWFPFSSVIIANIVSMSSRPLWLMLFIRCACETEGVASSLLSLIDISDWGFTGHDLADELLLILQNLVE